MTWPAVYCRVSCVASRQWAKAALSVRFGPRRRNNFESGSTSIPGIPVVLVVAQRLLQNKSVIPQTPYTSVHPIDPDVLVLTLMVLHKGLVTLLSGKRVDRG
jgi:hypothetical protein